MTKAGTARAVIGGLRHRIARLERREGNSAAAALGFGLEALDDRIPGRGLQRGALHEVAGAGPDIEHGAAAALFVAGILARLPGMVLWALGRRDLFAPALAAAGLHPDRVLYAEAGRPRAVLLVMEEGLRQGGLAAVVGEVGGRLGLTPSRRLQLAAEGTGTLAIALRRSRRFDDPLLAEPSAAVTRWRVAALPSLPVLPDVARQVTPGLGAPRWRLDLLRARGGEAHSWIVEACDATGRLGLAADMGDRPAPAARPAAA